MAEEDEIYLTLASGNSLNDVGNIGEVRIDGPSFTVYGDEGLHLNASTGEWDVTNGDAIGQPSLTNQSFPSIILGQAK